MGLSPAKGVTDEEKAFVHHYLSFGNASEAFREAFPDKADDATKKSYVLLKDKRIIAYMEYCELPTAELASSVIRDGLLTSGSLPLAKAALDREEKENVRTATERWAQIMCEIGAEVVVPGGPEGDKVFQFSNLMKSQSRSKT